jgi:hypothetical protein
MDNSVSPIEQDHINRALESSQTSMDAIGTITDVASYTLTLLGVLIALLAIWGIKEIWERAEKAAERIANKRLASYIASPEFYDFVKNRIDKSVEARWQESQIGSMEEKGIVGGEGDSPFPPPPDVGN